jgi:hypothetical protein
LIDISEVIALMMEAVSTPELRSITTRLHGSTSQEIACFRIMNEM